MFQIQMFGDLARHPVGSLRRRMVSVTTGTDKRPGNDQRPDRRLDCAVHPHAALLGDCGDIRATLSLTFNQESEGTW